MDFALTRQQSREIDRIAVEQYGIPSIVLMENAGRGCVDVLERVGIDGPVVILCGKGNNAGDGFVIARHLDIRGYNARVLLLAPSQDPARDLRGDAATNFALVKSNLSNVEVTTFHQPDNLPTANPSMISAQLDFHAKGAVWLVDAMLGTGAVGEPRPPFDAAIIWMNAQPAKKLAVDVPSGLDCDTGQPAAHTVRADHTCTFAAMKIGFRQPSAKPFTGTIHVCDIGVPPELIKGIADSSH
jgi:NAD(P)H-hydrate epimerase